MRIRFRYVTVEVDDRLRQRLALAVDRLRINVTAYLHIASDDVGVASQRLRGMCEPPNEWMSLWRPSTTASTPQTRPQTDGLPRSKAGRCVTNDADATCRLGSPWETTSRSL